MPDVDEKLKACPDPMSNENQIVKLSGCEGGPFIKLSYKGPAEVEEAPQKRTRFNYRHMFLHLQDGDEDEPTADNDSLPEVQLSACL